MGGVLLPVWAGWIAGVFTLLGFDTALRALSPGVYARSRYVYAAITLALSPVFSTAVLQDPDGLAATGLLLWNMAAFGRVMDTGSRRQGAVFVLTGLLAVLLKPAVVFLWMPMAVMLANEYPRWRMAIAAFGVLGAAGWMWGYAANAEALLCLPKRWSLDYFFIKSASPPNAALLWRPVAHPFFCLPLPALFLLFKKTDVGLYARRVLLLGLVLQMLYFSGVYRLEPVQLLPTYVGLLVLLFAAWDRFYAYGRYFFPRLSAVLIALAALSQVVALIFFHT